MYYHINAIKVINRAFINSDRHSSVINSSDKYLSILVNEAIYCCGGAMPFY